MENSDAGDPGNNSDSRHNRSWQPIINIRAAGNCCDLQAMPQQEFFNHRKAFQRYQRYYCQRGTINASVSAVLSLSHQQNTNGSNPPLNLRKAAKSAEKLLQFKAAAADFKQFCRRWCARVVDIVGAVGNTDKVAFALDPLEIAQQTTCFNLA